MRGVIACNELPATRLPIAERKFLRFMRILAPAGRPISSHFQSRARHPCECAPARSFTRYARLHPPRYRGLLLQNDRAQKMRLRAPVPPWGEQAIPRAQSKAHRRSHTCAVWNELLPPLRAVPIAAGAEDPSPVALICVGLVSRTPVRERFAEYICVSFAWTWRTASRSSRALFRHASPSRLPAAPRVPPVIEGDDMRDLSGHRCVA
jgi:hypothetical protein